MERDCKNCIHRVPILDEKEGIWKGECDVWDCDFVSRTLALESYQTTSEQIKELGTEVVKIIKDVMPQIVEQAKDWKSVPKSNWREVHVDDYDGELLWFRCLNCKDTTLHKWNFCPNCGADMRGNENEQ